LSRTAIRSRVRLNRPLNGPLDVQMPFEKFPTCREQSSTRHVRATEAFALLPPVTRSYRHCAITHCRVVVMARVRLVVGRAKLHRCVPESNRDWEHCQTQSFDDPRTLGRRTATVRRARAEPKRRPASIASVPCSLLDSTKTQCLAIGLGPSLDQMPYRGSRCT
jgi:hypothetical protein